MTNIGAKGEPMQGPFRRIQKGLLEAGVVLAIAGAVYSPMHVRAQEPASLPDSTLGVLTGRSVQVTLTDGTSVAGELAGFDAKTTTILGVDGQVVVINRSKIAAITITSGQPADAPASSPPASAPASPPPSVPSTPTSLVDEPEPEPERDAGLSPAVIARIDGDAIARVLLSGSVPGACAIDSSSELCRAHLRKGVESLDVRAKEKLVEGVVELSIGAAVGIPITAWLGVTASARQAAEDACRATVGIYGESCGDTAADWWGGTVLAGLGTGALVIAGVVNMGIGSKARRIANQTRSTYRLSLAPAHSRRFTGVSLVGRF